MRCVRSPRVPRQGRKGGPRAGDRQPELGLGGNTKRDAVLRVPWPAGVPAPAPLPAWLWTRQGQGLSCCVGRSFTGKKDTQFQESLREAVRWALRQVLQLSSVQPCCRRVETTLRYQKKCHGFKAEPCDLKIYNLVSQIFFIRAFPLARQSLGSQKIHDVFLE